MIPGTLVHRYRWAIAWMSFWTYVALILLVRGY